MASTASSPDGGSAVPDGSVTSAGSCSKGESKGGSPDSPGNGDKERYVVAPDPVIMHFIFTHLLVPN